jgi:hypothetical protein
MFAFQVVTARDIQSLVIAAALILSVALVAIYFRQRLRNFLTGSEWRIFFKLVGIVVLAMLLLFTSIAVEFPAAQFIYGRF